MWDPIITPFRLKRNHIYTNKLSRRLQWKTFRVEIPRSETDLLFGVKKMDSLYVDEDTKDPRPTCSLDYQVIKNMS